MDNRLFRRLWGVFQPKAIRHGEFYLPPQRMRFCNDILKQDEYFLESGREEVERLVEQCGLTQHSAILDIGSGQGRLAIGLLQRFKNFRDYHGIDIHKPSIEWCRKWVSRYHPQIVFTHVDVKNDRYNPNGNQSCDRLPVPSNRFDVVYLYSVFTYMRSTDVAAYLKEIQRVLRPGGVAMFTAFVEVGVPDETVNPTEYPDCESRVMGKLHRVRFERSYFEALVDAAGLTITYSARERWGQTIITVSNS